jgi:hypothetical protein
MVTQFLQTIFSPLVLLFTVSNLVAMELRVKKYGICNKRDNLSG